MTKVIGATLNIFFSIILGAVAFAFVAVQAPELMQDTFFSGASWLREQLTTTDLDPKYNVWVPFLINEPQLVLMGFVIFIRVALALAGAMLKSMFGR